MYFQSQEISFLPQLHCSVSKYGLHNLCFLESFLPVAQYMIHYLMALRALSKGEFSYASAESLLH